MKLIFKNYLDSFKVLKCDDDAWSTGFMCSRETQDNCHNVLYLKVKRCVSLRETIQKLVFRVVKTTNKFEILGSVSELRILYLRIRTSHSGRSLKRLLGTRLESCFCVWAFIFRSSCASQWGHVRLDLWEAGTLNNLLLSLTFLYWLHPLRIDGLFFVKLGSSSRYLYVVKFWLSDGKK
jgi:hypothetical protein